MSAAKVGWDGICHSQTECQDGGVSATWLEYRCGNRFLCRTCRGPLRLLTLTHVLNCDENDRLTWLDRAYDVFPIQYKDSMVYQNDHVLLSGMRNSPAGLTIRN